MTVTRRQVLETGLAAGGLALTTGFGAAPAFSQTKWSGGGTRVHGHTLGPSLKYAPGFKNFDYVRLDAPKGGAASRMGYASRFDNFNPYIVRGDATYSVIFMHLNEPLMTQAYDEDSSQYGLVAEWMEYPSDYSWAAYKIRDEARYHDGRPITPADLIYSLELMKTKASPRYSSYYKNATKAVDEGENIVRFHFDVTSNRELPHILGQLVAFPKHWWEGREFGDPNLDPPLGSGPYKIAKFESGRFVEYERVKDYWGADLPVNIGHHNLDKVRWEYYTDGDAAFEAFKADRLNYREENSAGRWADQYTFPAVKRGDVKKIEHHTKGPKPVQFFVFNTRKKKFQDRRVREALGLAFDFEYSNKALFHNQYARPESYFQGSPSLMATGVPSGDELALLETYRDKLPEKLFTEAFSYPKTRADGTPRRNLRRARRLLREAGCEVVDGTLRLPGGEPFALEFLVSSDRSRIVIDPFLQNMSRVLGVQAEVRQLDAVQYIRRIQSFDYDMVLLGVANSASPGNEQRNYWSSATADIEGSRNYAGVKNPVVDELIQKIIFSKDRSALEAASKALDRVLLWEHYNVLELYAPFERIAHWKSIAGPDPLPSRDPQFPMVWWSTEA